jgi:hypothetical protein
MAASICASQHRPLDRLIDGDEMSEMSTADASTYASQHRSLDGMSTADASTCESALWELADVPQPTRDRSGDAPASAIGSAACDVPLVLLPPKFAQPQNVLRIMARKWNMVGHPLMHSIDTWEKFFGPMDDYSFDGPPWATYFGPRFWAGMGLVADYNEKVRPTWRFPLEDVTACYMELPVGGPNKHQMRCPKDAGGIPGSKESFPAFAWPDGKRRRLGDAGEYADGDDGSLPEDPDDWWWAGCVNMLAWRIRPWRVHRSWLRRAEDAAPY